MMEPKDITEEMHQDFYRFTTNLFDSPRYHLQYKIDAPLNIRALFYVPEHKPSEYTIVQYCEFI
jgi:TNF receptor-associated protein 1